MDGSYDRGHGIVRRSIFVAASLALLNSVSVHARIDRSDLPIPSPVFDGVIAENVADSRPATPRPVRAPQGAPNVFLFMSDDVGFAMASSFGGPVPTPNMDRVAAQGQRYNRFHTTGICSPTRASLLTGRSPHNAATGYLSDLGIGYPGYTAQIPASTATIAQTLRLSGYSTAMFGKHHNIPPGQASPAGPFDMWPTGLGFEYFYGIVGGDSDQWHAALYRGTSRLPDPAGPAVLMDKRLADDAIEWVHNQKAAAPDKPFFVYYAPGSTHAPHQAPPEFIARFKGQFDRGWDAMRVETHKRQLAAGIIPKGTKLTPRPDAIPAWDSLSSKRKAFAARTMEVAAAMLAYQDEQLGRVLGELERMGELDKTLVAIIQGDNGASSEAGPDGTVNELGAINGAVEDEDWLFDNIDRLGSEKAYPSYPAGWAWVMNTPLRWTKQYASMLGAVRNGMILSVPGKNAHPGGICAQFGHVNDMAPTIFDAAGIPAPARVFGIAQKPMDGQSLIPSLAACQPDKPRTQYFEISGKFSLYHDGWFLSGDNDRKPWQMAPTGGARPETTWSLYDLRKDFSQSTDISAANPAQLAAMKARWQDVAKANNVFPLDHLFGPGRARPPQPVRKVWDFWGKNISLPINHQPTFGGKSYQIDADISMASAQSSGVVVAIGSLFGGWSLFIENGKPVFAYSASSRPQDTVRITATAALPAGESKLQLVFKLAADRKSAVATIKSGEAVLVTGPIPLTFLSPAGIGETLDFGLDRGSTVTDYATPNGLLDGEIHHVRITFD